MKKLLALLLAAAVCLTPALAATEDLFPAVNAYPGFGDVAEGQWYTDAVKTCFEVGIMNGVEDGSNFDPQGVMTVAQAATIAARIREAVTGQPIPRATPLSGQTRAWYEDYVDYLTAAGVDVALPTQRATRAQFFTYLAAVVPEGELPAINAIERLPDTEDAAVLRFYNAGILTGTDDYGTFNAAGSLSRAECAAMVARVLRPGLRQRFTPQEKPAETAPDFQQDFEAAMAIMVNGKSYSIKEFVSAMDKLIYQTELSLYRASGQRLDWSGQTDYGVGDLGNYFANQTALALIRQTVTEQQAKAFGCATDDLAATLTPNPSQEVLEAYANGMDYLAAKHILLKTYDAQGGQVYSDEQAKALAQQIIAAIDQNPTMQQFENLLALYGDDPGMQSNPEGYLFTAGEMVEEFETAVRELSVGGYSQEPVKSVYGYHVIVRLDPTGLSELVENYQQKVLDQLVEGWADEATVTVNSDALGKLDVHACYTYYLEALSANG